MRTTQLAIFASILLLLTVSLAIAGERTSASYSITTDTTDSGGQRAISANYSNAGSASLVAGISTIAAPAEIAKSGYIAQLYEIAGLIVNSAAPTMNEGASLQLGAWQLLDDATFLAVNANAVAWGAAIAPIASISAGGLATAQIVYENTPASVGGAFGGFTGSLNLTVLDSIPDNFGDYAGDGLGDDWQVQYFGQNNPLAAPALDPDGDGQDNLFEFTAGLVPTDPASFFQLRLAPVPGQPSQKKLIFSPRLVGRSYVPQFRLSLTTGAWHTLTTSTESNNGTERTVTDLSAAGAAKFYRVEITRP